MVRVVQTIRSNIIIYLCTLLALSSTHVYAAETAVTDIKISNTSLEHVEYNQKIYGLGYFTISNTSDIDHLITSVTSPQCNKVTAYHTDQESNIETANLFSHMALPAHSVIVFPPGGYHLVCIGPKSDLPRGESIEFIFSFLDHSPINTQFVVTK